MKKSSKKSELKAASKGLKSAIHCDASKPTEGDKYNGHHKKKNSSGKIGNSY